MNIKHGYTIAIGAGCAFIVAALINQYGFAPACYGIGGAIIFATIVFAIEESK